MVRIQGHGEILNAIIKIKEDQVRQMNKILNLFDIVALIVKQSHLLLRFEYGTDCRRLSRLSRSGLAAFLR